MPRVQSFQGVEQLLSHVDVFSVGSLRKEMKLLFIGLMFLSDEVYTNICFLQKQYIN